MITDLVLLPCVASMSLLSSLASSRSLLAGAEDGEIIAITRLDTRKLPKPILSKLGSITLLSYI